jgi:uncharacterized Zn-finger protein
MNSKTKFRSIFFLNLLQTEAIKLGDQKFACPFCTVVMKTPHKIQEHIRVHTGEKPFQCLYCNQKFTQGSSRSRHMRTIHNHAPSRLDDLGKIYE